MKKLFLVMAMAVPVVLAAAGTGSARPRIELPEGCVLMGNILCCEASDGRWMCTHVDDDGYPTLPDPVSQSTANH